MNHSSRWPGGIPPQGFQALTVAKAQLNRWVAIFCVLSSSKIYRSAQFGSHLIQFLFSSIVCTCIRTTAYRLTANGAVPLTAEIRSACSGGSRELDRPSPLILLGICSSLKSDLDCSAAELAFGATILLPGEMIRSTLHGAVEDPANLLNRFGQFVRILSPVPPMLSVSESYHEQNLAACSYVCLRCDRVCRPLEPSYGGSFRGRRPLAFNAGLARRS
nr:unnamed protein product [Spirometra erinaceieuropaei]